MRHMAGPVYNDFFPLQAFYDILHKAASLSKFNIIYRMPGQSLVFWRRRHIIRPEIVSEKAVYILGRTDNQSLKFNIPCFHFPLLSALHYDSLL